MKKLLFSCLLFLACSGAYAKSVFLEQPDQPIDIDISGLADFNIFETADRVLHFTAQRVLHFSTGELYVCPHNALISGELEKRKCTVDGQTSAWLPLMVLNVDGFEIVGVRFTFTTKNDAGLLIYFRKRQQ